MIVIVESNFVLELAFRQEEAGAAEGLLDLARKREIELAIPACALFEPFETLVRRRKERSKTLEKFRNQMRELGRSAHFPDLHEASERVARVLAGSGETEAASLDSVILKILGCADVIALSAEILSNSFRARERFPFQPQDSVVFASADWHLSRRGGPDSVFANKNSTDFALPDVQTHFAGLNCKLLSSFSNALNVVVHRANGTSASMDGKV